MNDRELLELAAKAAGEKGRITERVYGNFSVVVLERGDGSFWIPQHDDGEALRLAVKLRLSIFMNWSTVFVGREDSEENPIAFIDSGEQERDLQAVRETIVRAAAEIGRAMP